MGNSKWKLDVKSKIQLFHYNYLPISCSAEGSQEGNEKQRTEYVTKNATTL